MEQSELTHSALVEQAAVWLRKRCSTVLTELVAGIGEVPDALGWSGPNSTLIECKVSVEDFRADQDKRFRRFPEMGIGNLRYYCAPKGLLNAELLPQNWGLLEWDGKRMREVKKAERIQDINRDHEIEILISTLRRIAQVPPKGCSIRCYTIETQNRATLGVSREEEIAPQNSADGRS